MIKIIPFLIFLFLLNNLYAQCNISGSGLFANPTASSATCPLNGSIVVSITASASGAPFTFTLSGSCLTVPITQSQTSPNYTFNSLQGNCTYTVCISDAGGNIISRSATVNTNYSLLTGLVINDSMYTNASCSKLTAFVTGGRSPYSYELFNGTTATGTPIQGPQVSNQFSNISPSVFYSIRVTDACGQSIVATKNTSPYKIQSVSIPEYVLESCTSIREVIFLNGTYGGEEFQNNDFAAAANAGLKFPIIITARNSAGGLISGYPYTVNGNTAAGWGQSPNINIGLNARWSPKIPNNPALFPITFSYTDACGSTATVTQTYPTQLAKAAFVTTSIGASLDTNVCPIKSCFVVGVGGNYISGNNYSIGLYLNAASTGTALQTISYPSQSSFCGLNFNTTYYFKIYDPCLNKDTITSNVTGQPLPPFTVTINNCYTFCNGLSTSGFSYTGLHPNSIVATSGPTTSGPYPKPVLFTAGSSSNVSGSGSVSGLSPGTYNLVFTTKCGETANASLTVTQGNLSAQPVVTITPTGCASSSVNVKPRVSATGQMLAYHTAPGCHTTAGVSYYANIIFGQVSGGAALPGSNNIVVDNPNDGFTVSVTTPGTYVAITAYSQGLPGINNSVSSCYQIKRDTFTLAFNTIPTIVRIYTLPCASGAYSIVPIAPNAVTGTTYTLLAANGLTILAGPQISNTFSNITANAGTSLIIKALDPCGQSSIVPFSITTATTIAGSIDCLSIGTNSSADSLHADFINGATYTWTAPNGNVFTGNNPPLVIPSQTGVWTLTTTIQTGLCTAVLNNSFTTVACGFVPPPPPPVNDPIILTTNTNACKVTLNWTTTTEVNSLRFDVEESSDNIIWHVLATRVAAGTSTIIQQYSVIITPNTSHVFYRVKQINVNATIKYSNIVEVNILCPNINNDILILDNNPVSGNIYLQLLSSIGRVNAVLIFVDAIGRQYLKQPLVVNMGINYYVFKRPQYLAKGVYFVKIFAANQGWFSNTVKVLLIK